MQLPLVPVIVKCINPNVDVGEEKSRVLTVVSLHAFPIQLCERDTWSDDDALNIEPRLACSINGVPYLLTLAPERETPETIIYETYIPYVEPETANDESDISGASGSEEDSAPVSRPVDGSGDEASGGDETPDSEEVHH